MENFGAKCVIKKTMILRHIRYNNQGQEVAVKVLHPKIKSNFLRDLVVLKSLVNGVSWMFPQLNWLSVKESLNEFAKLMNVQVDLKNEAQNLLKFHENFKNDGDVKFPRPLMHLCNEEVLVESFEHGTHLGSLIQDLSSISDERRKLIAAKGIQMFLKMVFRHNFVHADLHPGNILVNDDDNLVILDPGLTTTLSPKDRRNFRYDFSFLGKDLLHKTIFFAELCFPPWSGATVRPSAKKSWSNPNSNVKILANSSLKSSKL